ncbi:hypothetical protein AKJ59_00775 [candidate division MSBL1 archaeon SCGC-AAA385M02]|uniref:Lysozyme n=1 Tax=candidate division MSBL1 archaeon SCGC-AAA385M02 TaxID=1698287 RepID=A0A133VQ49_9EURY|nr:hypothetical protein AKJ59_00775 [candidate division MSBL1 archaeon SCGC-AAA385M02]
MKKKPVSRLRDQLKRHEGFRGKPYEDTTGHTTIGYGRNLEANPLSKSEASLMLENDIIRTYNELIKRLPWILDLNRVRQEALINMAFNLGVGGLLRFKKMLKALREEEYSQAGAEALASKWAEQVGNRATEIAFQIKRGEYIRAGW